MPTQFPQHPGGKGPGREFRASVPAFPDTPTLTLVSPNTSRIAGGTLVTLTGTNFKSVPVVTFGGISATSVVLISSTSLTCIVPTAPEAGSVDVVLTFGSRAATLHNGFTYVTSDIVSLSPAYGAIAGGVGILIFGYNFVAGSTVTLGGSAATGVIFIDSQHIKCTVPAHAEGFVDIVVTEPGGATATKRNGFQYTLLTRGNDIRRMPGIVIEDTLNNSPNQCNFTVDGSSNTPIVGEKIEIIDSEDGDRLLFAGTAVGVEQVYEDQIDQLAWHVQCIDFTWLLNRKRPFGSYLAKSASDIVIDLIRKFAPGFTTNHVQTNLAKVTVTYDGSKDLSTALSELGGSIGGGHWYTDYDMDVHFFHIAPPAGAVTGGNFAGASIPLTSPMTIATGASLSSGASAFPGGYLFFRQSFLYDDGSETGMGPISNVLEVDGGHKIAFANVQTGAAIGTLTCIARRIYGVYLFAPGKTGGSVSFDDYKLFCQVNDNTTTAFSCGIGPTEVSSSVIVAIPSTVVPDPPVTGHPAGPTRGPWMSSFFNVYNPYSMGRLEKYALRAAFLYRDGSVSFAGPAGASSAAGISGSRYPESVTHDYAVFGYSHSGYHIHSIPVGPSIGDNDVVARLLYFASGELEDPNYVDNTPVTYQGNSTWAAHASGDLWPVKILEPTWNNTAGVLVIPDNTSADLPSDYTAYPYHVIDFADYGFSDTPLDLGGVAERLDGKVVMGADGNFFANPSEQDPALAIEPDPIPLWPNPDGPSLEDDDPPDDLTDTNTDLLHESAGQAVTLSTDLTQIRNRVYVSGSGSNTVKTSKVGDKYLAVADANAFSRNGGTLRIENPSNRQSWILRYWGIQGTVGNQQVCLVNVLPETISQGASVVNFLQADNVVSQKAMGQAELDVNGNTTDGIHEYMVADSSLKAHWQLLMRARAELELFSTPIVTLRYSTRDPKSRSGQTVHVDLTNPPVQGDFLIQSVTIDQIHDESDELLPRYTVTATSVRYELNDLLLKILTEQTGAHGPSTLAASSSSAAAGVGVAGATSNSLSSSATPHAPYKVWGGMHVSAIGATVICTGEISGLANPTGTAAIQIDSNGDVFRRLTATSSDSITGFNAGVAQLSSNDAGSLLKFPIVEFLFRTGPSVTNCRYWCGLMVSPPPQGFDDLRTSSTIRDGVGFCKSQTSPYWSFFSSVATIATTRTPTTIPVLTNTLYRIRLEAKANSTMTVTINGVSQDFSYSPTITTASLGAFLALNSVLNTNYLDFVSIYWERLLLSSIPN